MPLWMDPMLRLPLHGKAGKQRVLEIESLLEDAKEAKERSFYGAPQAVPVRFDKPNRALQPR